MKNILVNLFHAIIRIMIIIFCWILFDAMKLIVVLFVAALVIYLIMIIYWDLKKIRVLKESIESAENFIEKLGDELCLEKKEEEKRKIKEQKDQHRNQRMELNKECREIKCSIQKKVIESIAAMLIAGFTIIVCGTQIKIYVYSNLENGLAKGENELVHIQEGIEEGNSESDLSKTSEDKEQLDLLEELQISDDAKSIPNIVFFLPDEDGVAYLDQTELEKVFYLNDFTDTETQVREHFISLMGENKEDAFSKEASKSEDDDIDLASKLEGDFVERMKKAEKCIEEGDKDGWEECVGNYKDLDEIIEKRRNVAEAERGNRKICFLIANDYQKYADECRRQKKDAYMILDYEINAIIWAERALEYDSSSGIRRNIYNYIRGRYQDIASLTISEDYLEQSEAISDTMKKIIESLDF